MTKKEAHILVGGLSKPSKMPCYGYSLPASACKLGSKLRSVPGSTCEKCYAHRGNYGFPAVRSSLAKRLSLVQKACDDLTFRKRFIQAFTVLLKGQEYFRWHDSGDLQDMEHAMLIRDICLATPNTKHWIPTREYAIARVLLRLKTPNLTVRCSAPMIDGPPPMFRHTSTVVNGSGNCPAIADHTGKCGDCRKCWNKRILNVAYGKH